MLRWNFLPKYVNNPILHTCDADSRSIEYCEALICYFLPLGADKHQPSGVDHVGQIQDEVDGGENSDRHLLIPAAQTVTEAAGAGAVLPPAVFGVKIENGPDDGGREVEQDG